MSGITRREMLVGLTAGLALTLVGCAPSAVRVSMACGDPGGLYIQLGNLLRDALSGRGAAELEVVATNGSAENLALLSDGGVDLAIALADAAEQNAQGIVAIGRVYQNYLQCVVRADGPVRRLDDLAGREISIGAPGSGCSLTTRRLLDARAMDRGPGAPFVSEHELDEALAALGAGEIDALFWSGGIPTPQIDAFGDTQPIALIDLSPALPGLEAAYPDVYRSTEIPPGVYGTNAATPTLGIPNYLLSLPTLPDAVARALVDVLIDDAPDLVPADSVGVQFLTPANLIDTGAVPLHPAARQRYREQYR